jgi:hypothetical protein
MRLRDVAHARTGDKGEIVNCSVIAYQAEDYEWLEAVVTPERVRAHLGALIQGDVRRYTLPGLAAMNFVLTRPSGDSVTRTLALDPHGKSLSSALLELLLPERT